MLFPRKANIPMMILISIHKDGTQRCDGTKTTSHVSVAIRNPFFGPDLDESNITSSINGRIEGFRVSRLRFLGLKRKIAGITFVTDVYIGPWRYFS
jgi:hypothetical protein